ncbi:MAG: response regulator [Planctomycetes bacterium]|nr:response regulator [Planctomycetota bacterium]
MKLLESENFDLVLSDLAMPEVSGREILNTIKKLEKRPKAGIITGWAGMLDALRADSLPVDFVINKPAEPLEVSALIGKTLGTVRKD